jgi:4-hydroxybenzoate polyprenyltransferase
MSKLKAYLQLTRPANVITAIADIWAGFAVAGGASLFFSADTSLHLSKHGVSFLWLTLATVGLYGGGVAFNDVFDAELDAVERPERPIPSGKVSLRNAIVMSSMLLIGGVLAAFQVSWISGLVAFAVAGLAVLYDYWGKHQRIFGPINMGLCRAGNLMLGVSVIPVALFLYWPLSLIPLGFVAAITMISRGEVHGKNKKALLGGLALYAIIWVSIIFLAFRSGWQGWYVLPFLFFFGYMIFPPLLKAIKLQQPALIGKAVKAGVISLIILNACISAAFAGWEYALIVVLLLPLSLWLAKIFAVT